MDFFPETPVCFYSLKTAYFLQHHSCEQILPTIVLMHRVGARTYERRVGVLKKIRNGKM